MSSAQVLAGLDRVVPRLEQKWGRPIRVEPVQTIVGFEPCAGSRTPLPSSAARLVVGEVPIWIPAPLEAARPDQGQAPLFLQAGRRSVLPTIRLIEPPSGPRYLAIADWLDESLTRWRFPLVRPGSLEPILQETRGRVVPGTCTILDSMSFDPFDPVRGLEFLARMIAYALFGAAQTERRPLDASRWLVIPRRPRWLRPVGRSPLGERVARALVVTALRRDPDVHRSRDGIPRLPRPHDRYRIQPTSSQDWGIDPVHTSENEEIRLNGRLGASVRVREGKLWVPDGLAVPLSASTARLPFAGSNDPRRLLLAAGMQAQAVSLSASEPPLVYNEPPEDDPPGVNLRVAYVAWQGWNHEDAWVISESAARRLLAVERWVQVIAVRAVELPPHLLVAVGQPVKRGQLLVRRQVAPALLAPALEDLVGLRDLGETVPLDPDPDDRARFAATIERIETWDLQRGGGLPPDWHVAADLASRYRLVVRVSLRRDLPLASGDKLANRHGHKGIVGAILPDDQMPRWQGEPLNALIDPISVLNRSNWGQLVESLAGAVARRDQSRWPANRREASEALALARSRLGANLHGQMELFPPPGPGEDRPFLAVAGIQFVLRLPQHAVDQLAAHPAPTGGDGDRIKPRAQRFGEMEHWSCLAHGLERALLQPPRLAPAAEHLRRLLAQAGFDLRLTDSAIAIRRLELDRPPWDVYRVLRLDDRSLPELFDAVDEVTGETPTALVFDPPVPLVPLPRSDRAQDIHWLPLLPRDDRPPCAGPDGSLIEHELTSDLRAVIRAAREWWSQGRADDPRLALRARRALASLMKNAYALGVGWSGDGPGGNKWSLLRREVLGRRRSHSARATIAPTGPWEFGLDTIGLPTSLARAVLDLPDADEAALIEAGSRLRIWIKRDPLLHRWGLLPVRFRPVSGDAIRLPPALLGPMGADFDGDTVAVFALSAYRGSIESVRPSALACHDLLNVPMFLAGKQYVWGLDRLSRNRTLKDALNQALQEAGAPPWPDGSPPTSTRQVLEEWVRTAAADPNRDGRWWGILETFALKGLALDPGMGLGLFPWTLLRRLEPIQQGAAKRDLYQPGNAAAMMRYLEGRSLEIYRQADPQDGTGPGEGDPIAEVMIAARASIGSFGGVFRRLLYSTRSVDAGFLRQGQALAEQLTQQVLSIKAGTPPLGFTEFRPRLLDLLEGTEAPLPESLAHLTSLWSGLSRRFQVAPSAGSCPDWLRWLRLPHELAERVDESPDGALRLPLDDPRGQLFLATSRMDEPPVNS